MIDQNSIIQAIQRAMQSGQQQAQQQGGKPGLAQPPAAPTIAQAPTAGGQAGVGGAMQQPSLISSISSAMQGNPTGGLLAKLFPQQAAQQPGSPMSLAPQAAAEPTSMMNPGLLSGMGLY